MRIIEPDSLEAFAERVSQRTIERYAERAPVMSNYVDIDGLCVLLGGVHRVTARRWAAQGKLPAPRLLGGKLHRWKIDEVLDYLDKLPRASNEGGA